MQMAQRLMQALLGLVDLRGTALPMPQGAQVKTSRRVNHLRLRVKAQHHGYPGAKIARKAVLGELGLSGPVTTLQAWAMRNARSRKRQRS